MSAGYNHSGYGYSNQNSTGVSYALILV